MSTTSAWAHTDSRPSCTALCWIPTAVHKRACKQTHTPPLHPHPGHLRTRTRVRTPTNTSPMAAVTLTPMFWEQRDKDSGWLPAGARVQLCPRPPPFPVPPPWPFACWPVAKPCSVPGPPGACVPDSRGIAPSSSPSLCQEGRESCQAGANAALLLLWPPPPPTPGGLRVCTGVRERSWPPVTCAGGEGIPLCVCTQGEESMRSPGVVAPLAGTWACLNPQQDAEAWHW